MSIIFGAMFMHCVNRFFYVAVLMLLMAFPSLSSAEPVAEEGISATPASASSMPSTGIFIEPQINHEPTVDFDVKVDPPMLPADGKTEAEIRVVLTDTKGDPLVGHQVGFSLEEGYGRLTPTFPITDDDGVAEAVYVSGHVAASALIRVEDNESGEFKYVEIPTSITASISLELVEPSRFISSFIKKQTATQFYTMSLEVFPDKLVADSFSTSRITVTLLKLDGSYAAGVPLEFKLLSGNGEIIRDRTTTDQFGILEAFYRAGDKPGTAIIEALEPTTGLSKTVEVLVFEAGPAKIKLFFSDQTGKLFEESAKIPADGISTITVVAQVLNLVDMPVPGVDVKFAVAEDLGIIELLDTKSDPQGNVYATFRAGTQTGLETITAYLISPPIEDDFTEVDSNA
jgi:hypothetical protein